MSHWNHIETYEEATWFAEQFQVMLEKYADQVWEEGYVIRLDKPLPASGESRNNA